MTDNRASGSGGGISNGTSPGTGNITIVRTTVGRNVAGISGGGCFVLGRGTPGNSFTLKDSTIRRNIAAFGSGIRATAMTLTNCTVSGNAAVNGDGGGIFASDTATLSGCTISGNSATVDGGGIRGFMVDLTNHHQRHTADHDGGGMLVDTVDLTNCTVNGNVADNNGGGIFAIARRR